MSTKLIRLLKIITTIQARPGIKSNELMDCCGINRRTLYRYLTDLSLAHIPIQSGGRNQGYRFVGSFAMYPLNLTEEEAAAFAWFRAYINEYKDLSQSAISAFDKIMATISKEKSINKDMVQRIHDIFRLGRTAYDTSDNNYFEKIIQAMIEKRSVEAVYHTQSRNESNKRVIDPYYLIPRENKFYLIAFCHNKNEIRTFRLSRFQNIKILNSNYQINDFDINKYFKNTWSIERGDQMIDFKVRFSADIARYIKEEELFVIPRITDLPDEDIIFEVRVNSEREFLQWLKQYGKDAEILEPQEHRKKQLQELQEWIRMYVQ